MPGPPTFVDWLNQRSTVWMRQPRSSGWFGVTLAVPANEAVEGWLFCCRMHLLDDPESPDDVLPIIALDRKLPRYPHETAAQHRARLIDAWNIYPYAGTEHVIEMQLAAAGYPNAVVEFRPSELGPRGEAAPYRTQFWVVFADGYHPVTGPCKPWGTFVWGDKWTEVPGVWAPTGLTPDFYRTIMGIVLKWKPSQYVFRGFTFTVGSTRVELPIRLGTSAP
jgi:hypothetical protein